MVDPSNKGSDMAKYIKDDFVKVRTKANSKAKEKLQLVYGDKVEVLERNGAWTKLRLLSRTNGKGIGWAKLDPTKHLMNKGVLKFSMVDVQQGDGLVFETPEGKVVLIDGGDNKLFARHLAWRFFHKQSSKENPYRVDAMIITHGDADHFDGLNDIVRSETARGLPDRKRLFLAPKRIYHNGLVKMPGKLPSKKSRPDKQMFGKFKEVGTRTYATELHEDPSKVRDSKLNEPFKRWKKTLLHWKTRGTIDIKRIAYGDDENVLFDFLHAEGVTVKLQGPFTEKIDGKDAFRFFRAPKKSAEMHLRDKEGSISDSHTINGHSIALHVTYGNVRFNLTGDLNRPAMRLALKKIDKQELEAEIVKAPHHGSGDFDFEALKAMSPVVGIISSGDESAAKEHIHPKATLMAALGKVMRLDTGLILSTELAAFFNIRDYSHQRKTLSKFFRDRETETFTGKEVANFFAGKTDPGDPDDFYAFERTNFGIIHIRTDGERVLVFTHSGKKGVNEAYSFTVKMNANGEREISFKDKTTHR